MTEESIEIKTFRSLYGTDLKNKIKMWSIKVEKYKDHSVMKYQYGYIDGKQTECNQIVSQGKNIGKQNETTHFEQAISEAQSKWNKKKDSGYVIDLKQLQKTSTKENCSIKVEDQKIIYPMLAQDLNKHKQKLVFPAYIQPKLDGYRMIFNSKNMSCNSRQGKEFSIIKTTRLYKELQQISEEIILDGELYLHGGIFENLGILRKKTLNQNDKQYLEQIEYHVYDIVLDKQNFQSRLTVLTNLIKRYNFIKIKLVETSLVNDQKEIDEYHRNFIKSGFEGSILRNKSGFYKCKSRSMDLLKYKDFQDDEFEIVDYTYEMDTNKDPIDLIVWICKTRNGDLFNVRPGGTKTERQELYKQCQTNFIYKGKNLQVKYFELTERGIPRFPTTKTTSVDSYIRNNIE